MCVGSGKRYDQFIFQTLVSCHSQRQGTCRCCFILTISTHSHKHLTSTLCLVSFSPQVTLNKAQRFHEEEACSVFHSAVFLQHEQKTHVEQKKRMFANFVILNTEKKSTGTRSNKMWTKSMGKLYAILDFSTCQGKRAHFSFFSLD